MTVDHTVDTGVPPRAVQAWFFDLQENDHTRGDHPRILRAKPGDYRKILSRAPDRVEAEDAYQGGKSIVRFVLTKEGEHGIRYDVKGNWYDSTGHLVVTPQGAGSRVRFHSDWRWHPGTFFQKLLLSGMLKKAITEDFAAHVRDMEEDWKKQPW